MSKLNAKLIFILSAACFVVPYIVIEIYESVAPSTLRPGTNYANDTMQFLLNVSNDWLYPIGVLLFFVGIVVWYRESR